MRGETILRLYRLRYWLFQSTPLMRGETPRVDWQTCTKNDFNPLPSCEGRRHRLPFCANPQNFNPLPSCEGRLSSWRRFPASNQFQSTPLMRGETPPGCAPRRGKHISIHSPHARGDENDTAFPCPAEYFNPLPSCEGRRPCRVSVV